MNINLRELTPIQQKKLQESINYIRQKADPHYVICYSLKKQYSLLTHYYTENYRQEHCQLSLLLIYPDGRELAIQEMAGAISNEQFECIVTGCSKSEMLEQLEEGNLFMNTVFHKGAILYQKNIALSPINYQYHSRDELLLQTKENWHHWFTISTGFMDCASYCLAEKNYAMTAFMAHQVVEHTCKAMLRVLLGFNLRTHNVAWMLKLCNKLSSEIASIFPCSSQQEKHVFNLLKNSYINSRYTNNFEVTEQQAWVLFDRVSALQLIACKLCEKRIAKLHHPSIELSS